MNVTTETIQVTKIELTIEEAYRLESELRHLSLTPGGHLFNFLNELNLRLEEAGNAI